MRSLPRWLPFLAGIAMSLGGSASVLAQTPLPRAHAHNDYEHPRPLRDALDHGFCSFEADIHLQEGELRVAHGRDETRPGRTLEALYLDPLRERARLHGGRIFPNGPTVTLLIDQKTEAQATYRVLRETLARYSDILTRCVDGKVERNAVTVIISGNRPWDVVSSESVRHVFLDGRIPDLATNPPANLVPWISDHWGTYFDWKGKGEFPADQRLRLEELVKRAHEQERKVRFWGAPDVEAIWKAQWDAGVDHINTDRLADLAAFLAERAEPQTSAPAADASK